jgi:hypothetical protein
VVVTLNRSVLLHHLLYRRRGTGRKVGIPRVVSRDAVCTFSELRCGEGCLMSGGIDRTGAYGDGSILKCHGTSRISAERSGHRGRKSNGLPALGRIARGAHCRLGRRIVNSLGESRGCACVVVRIAAVAGTDGPRADRQRRNGDAPDSGGQRGRPQRSRAILKRYRAGRNSARRRLYRTLKADRLME